MFTNFQINEKFNRILLIILIFLLILLFYNQFIFDYSIVDESTKYTLPPIKDQLKSELKCCDRKLEMSTNPYGQYWLMENYIRGRLSTNMKCSESITYVVNADYTYMGNLSNIVERWLAPVSFALYAPGYDYNATMDSIQYVRHCLPASKLIRDYVTFHIFFPNQHMPSFVAITEEDALNWPYDCKASKAPYDNANVKRYNMEHNLTYPINVGRNIARKAVNTHFILSSDIEMYPSPGLVQQFLKMVAKNSTAILQGDKPKVFALPNFELAKNANLPNSKEELKQMLNKSMAQPMHIGFAKHCQLIPKYAEWIAAENDNNGSLEIFTVAKRYGNFGSWEPFYISDNTEPFFDERFTWEGQSDKRIQNYAMCLMDYEYHILQPAFLVHSPGIKSAGNPRDENVQRRQKYIWATKSMLREKITLEYLSLYGSNSKCKI